MFNGLRVGMGIAKGLVIGLGVPLLGVSTLEATALPHAAGNLPVVPVVAAGRGRLAWAIYEPSATGALRGIVEPRNGLVHDLAAQIVETGREVIVCGELTREQVGILGAVSTVRLPAEAIRGRRAAAVLELARARHTRGEEDDPITLEPLYLHAARLAG
jgi:tRNA threonylcarbamoyladenosine biosynthesis protein TsaB